MKNSTLFIVALSLIFIFTGVTRVLFAQNQGQHDPKEVVMKNLEAFNNHDVSSMLENIADDFSSYSILPDTTINGLTSKKQFEFTMSGYFKNYPNVKSELRDVEVFGRFVYFKEKAVWGSDAGHSQLSFGVYEIIDGKIKRAWYYQ